MKTLIIAEKNKAAEAIAEALGSVKIIESNKTVKVYKVLLKNIIIIPLRGHILEYKNSEKYKSWKNSNPREIITNKYAIEKAPKSYAFPFIKVLKKYAPQCDLCLIGTDADIEGCNIGLLDALPFVKQENNTINVKQLWLSSLDKKEILDKYNNPIAPKYTWAESGESRAIIDAIIGFSSSRQVTFILKPLLEKFNHKFTSIGRVQTCLLYLIYLRDKEIKDFIPEPFLTIEANLNYENNKFKAFHQLNPFNKDQFLNAEMIYNKIKDEKTAKVIDNSSKQIFLNPPSPLNTSKALILITKTLHISANLALKIMNDLYLDKIITYPRTDSDIYKTNFDHKSHILKFNNHSLYALFSKKLIANQLIYPTKGKKDAGDHPPITPIESLELENNKFKTKLHSKVYNILARHYLALFGERAIESRVYLKLSIKEEIFNSQLATLLTEGFLEIAPFLKRKYDSLIRITHDIFPVDKITLNKKETKPNPEYNDTTLLKLMEKNNLGTKSTRPIIIHILEKRALIHYFKKKYKITELGIFIIKMLEKIWLPFLKPEFTRMIEQLLEEIKIGKKQKEEVLEIFKKLFLELFDKLKNNQEKILTDISNYKITNISEKNSRSSLENITSCKCPFCNQNHMKLIEPRNKRKFLICLNDNCKEKYLSLPNKGSIYILKNSSCKLCGFNIFRINYRKNNKLLHYYLCPYCWNIGLKSKISGKGFCSNCETYKIEKNMCVEKKL